jgi:glucose-6-phosphate 1-dehydrogenase
MVQNLMVLRFANSFFEPIWNRQHISCVRIVFKEDFGTQGRGGYFDKFGIIRDVMQNHLMQIVSLVAMEPPVSLGAEDVRDEKVKVLRSMPEIKPEHVVTGQYTRDKAGKNEGYKDDKSVPKNSVTPTFAQSILFINNSRWSGVPFILKTAKAVEERKAEIRIQFRKSPTALFPEAQPNELVIRIQPSEAVYIKTMNKTPGLSSRLVITDLDLTYHDKFNTRYQPDAYERLILDAVRGDHNLFVRVDELAEAWRIFTPVLHFIDAGGIKPIEYEYGSRGPVKADEMAKAIAGWEPYTYDWLKK